MRRDFFQRSLFDDIVLKKNQQNVEVFISDTIVSKYKSYSLQDYIKDIETNGLKMTWTYMCIIIL